MFLCFFSRVVNCVEAAVELSDGEGVPAETSLAEILDEQDDDVPVMAFAIAPLTRGDVAVDCGDGKLELKANRLHTLGKESYPNLTRR